MAVDVKKGRWEYDVYLLLGSNLPLKKGFKVLKPKEILSSAIDRIKTVFLSDASVSDSFRYSKVLKTKPVGEFENEASDFYNQVVVFKTTLSPEEVLSVCQSIEEELGRKRSAKALAAGDNKKETRVYASRSVDIDMLKVYDLAQKQWVVLDTPRLQLPHPQIETRPFVKKLLKEIDLNP